MPIRYSTTLLVQDEGSTLGLATIINFVGTGVSAAISGSTVTVTIPGGISAINTNNTVFIDAVYGNDATGLPERDDKPFLTFAAARTAALAYFVGGDAPSATNRILYEVASGFYTQAIILDTFFDWNLNNSVIDLQAGFNATIDDEGVSCNCIVYGHSTIKRTVGSNFGCVSTSNAGSILIVYSDYILGRVIGVLGTQTIYVNITGTGNVATVECSGAIMNVYGNIIHNGNNNAALVSAGTLNIYNSQISGGGAETNLVSCGAGTLKLTNSRIQTTVAGVSCITKAGGTLIIKGLTLITTTGDSITTNGTAQNVKVYGMCEANKAVNANVTQQVNTIVIDSNVS